MGWSVRNNDDFVPCSRVARALTQVTRNLGLSVQGVANAQTLAVLGGTLLADNCDVTNPDGRSVNVVDFLAAQVTLAPWPIVVPDHRDQPVSAERRETLEVVARRIVSKPAHVVARVYDEIEADGVPLDVGDQVVDRLRAEIRKCEDAQAFGRKTRSELHDRIRTRTSLGGSSGSDRCRQLRCGACFALTPRRITGNWHLSAGKTVCSGTILPYIHMSPPKDPPRIGGVSHRSQRLETRPDSGLIAPGPQASTRPCRRG